MNKEELQKRVGELEAENSDMADALHDADELRRKDISQVLGSYIYKDTPPYSSGKQELYVYSWAQIFCEIGKLLEKKEKSNALDIALESREIALNVKEKLEEYKDAAF